jgi:predicted TIM-barrel fold metal-dependent hydrolase
MLATRPEWEETPEVVAAQLERCAREAEVRRAQPRPPARSSVRPTMEELVRQARRQQWSIRLGYPVWRVRRPFARLFGRSER